MPHIPTNTNQSVPQNKASTIVQAEADQNTHPTPTALQVDYGRYADYLDESDLTEDQKREFIQALWSIITAFVDLGFGVHPVQQAGEDQQLRGDKSQMDLSAALMAVLGCDETTNDTANGTGNKDKTEVQT